MNVSAVTRLRVNLKLKYFKDYTHKHGFVTTKNSNQCLLELKLP